MVPPDPPSDRQPSPDRSSDSGGFVPHKDPVVLTLSIILVGTVVIAAAGVTAGPILTGNDSDGVVFPVGELLNDTDDRETVSLQLAVNQTELQVTESVNATVTDSDGDPVPSARVTMEGTQHRVDANGTVTIAPESVGELPVVASAPATNTTTYDEDSVTLSVDRRVVGVAVQADNQTVTVDEPLELTLERTDTGTPIDGTITVDGTDHETTNGSVVIEPNQAGTLQISGNRSITDTERFRSGATTVDVERKVVSLVVAAPSSATVGDPVPVEIERADTGAPIEGQIEAGNQTVETTAGRANVTFEAAGAYEIRATSQSTRAERFDPATTTIDIERRSVELTVVVDRPVTTTGGTVTAQVLRANDRQPVNGTITVGDDEHPTGPDGTAAVQLNQTETVTLVGTAADTPTETFESAEQTVELGPGAVSITSLTAPETVAPGEQFDIEATVEAGDTDVVDTIVYRLDGELRHTELQSLAAGEREQLAFSVSAPDHEATVEGILSSGTGERTTTIQVSDDSSSAAEQPVTPSEAVIKR